MTSARIERSTTAFLLGASAGLVSAVAECLLVSLPLGWRVPYAGGVYGLLGGVLGLVVSWLLPARTGWRPVLACVVFVPVAAALALLANRVVLRDVHHLEPVSLAADGIALVLAAGVAGLAAAWARPLRPAPRLAATASTAPAAPAATGATALAAPWTRLGFALAAALVLAGGVAAPQLSLSRNSPPDARSPVILVSIDTLRPDRLGTGGEPLATTPELDRLCREAVHFPETFAVSPGSAASHAALLTSRYPISNGVHTNFSPLDESVTTLTEILRGRGYRTGGFVTNMFLGQRFGFPQGFDAYVQTGVVERMDEASPALLWRSLALVQIADHVRSRFQIGYDPSFETALRWIAESQRPSFFFVHFMDVHSPYVPPAPWGRRFGAQPAAAESGEMDDRDRADRSADRADEDTNPYGWRRSDEVYLAEVGFTDTKIGRLRRQLDELGLLDESVLVVTSDHGENLSDHAPHYSHGSTLFDATLRVLLAVRAPARLDRALDARTLENLDLPPTLAPLLDLPAHPDWEGRNALAADGTGRALTVSQIYRDFAVRTPTAKYLLKEDGTRAVLDLAADPAEKRPRTPVGEDLARAEAEFQRWYEAHVTELYSDGGREVAAEDLSPEARDLLRTLGYLQ